MIKVFENFDFSRVGQMQSLLEANGIRTFIRNEYGSSVMGGVPFVEVVPQLFVLEEADVARALFWGPSGPAACPGVPIPRSGPLRTSSSG